MHREAIRKQVLELREKGHSYTDISSRTGISKSTLSGWLADIPYTPSKETVERVGKAIAAANAAKTKQRQIETEEIRKMAQAEIGKLTKRDIFIFGLGLYFGEGGKTHDITRITNSDPQLIRAAIAWFLSLGVQKEQFAPRVHLYPDSNIDLCLQFWSHTTGLPKKQFLTSQVDWRLNKKKDKKGKLPFGTLHLGIRGGGRKEYGVQFHRKIQAWNESVLKEITKRN